MKKQLIIEKINLRRNADFHLEITNVSLDQGKVLGVVGPNGSGKTSLIECLAGLVTGPSINVQINGSRVGTNIAKHRASIGFIPDDEAWIIKELTAKEYFDLLLRTYKEIGLHETDLRYRLKYFSRKLSFTSFDQLLGSLSHGNRKKVQIIAALIHKPAVIVVDELRNGLDPLAIIAAEHIIYHEVERGASVVAATHDLWWAERMANDLIVLINGKMAIKDTIDSLLETYGSLEKLFTQLINNSPHSGIIHD